MHLKGLDKWKKKIPKYLGWRAAVLGLVLIVAFVIALTLMFLADSAARLFPFTPFLVLTEPIFPILGVLLCELIAFGLIWGVWHNRERYTAALGDLAYQKALPRGLFGVSWILAICIHIYVPLDALPAGTPVNHITVTLSKSILAFLGIPAEYDLFIRIIISATFIIIGLLTIRSAFFTFGIDYMALVYLYFPDESEIQQHEIYSIIRHPTYFGLLCIAMGGMWLRFSVYSLVLFVMFLFGLMTHIFLVEEKELQERFGESFIEYKKSVPALRVKIRDLKIFLRFLTKGGKG
jgi:protein-S-isoprenylcysteine O-methyltransferase Ste14